MTSDNPPYTIEELISELTRIAAGRGWGAQSLTNIREIAEVSGQRTITLLTGDEEKTEDLNDEIESLKGELKDAEGEAEELEIERDALKRAVEKLTHEVLILKEAARK